MNFLIETKRLIIRKFKDSDYADLHEYLSDPAIYIFEPGSPVSLEQAKELSAERAKGNDFLAVILKGTSRMIGHLYFKQVGYPANMTWELGYIFNSKYYRKGYASESARALVEYAFNNFKAHRIMARCDPNNPASWKLLEKVGFRREGHFKKCGTFRNNEAGNPVWHDAYEYGMLEEDL